MPGIPNPVDGLAQGATSAALAGLNSWVASGATWLLQQLVDRLLNALTPDFSVAWFVTLYGQLLQMAAALAPIFLLLAVIQALVTQNLAVLGRAVINLCLAFAIAGLVTGVTGKLIHLTDDVSIWLLNQQLAGGDVRRFVGAITAALSFGADPTKAGFVAFVAAAATVLFGLIIMIELVVRDAAVYVTVLFFPLFLVASIWPKAMSMVRQLAELLVGVILSKLVIVVVLVLGSSAFLGLMTTGDLTGAITGVAILMLAAFAPVKLLRLLPQLEVASAHVFNGTGQRTVASGVRGGHRQVVSLLDTDERSRGLASQMLYADRQQQTSSRLTSQGPPSTGGGPAAAGVAEEAAGGAAAAVGEAAAAAAAV